MLFPIAIEPGNDRQAYGVQVPDLPGCFSAGDTLDEAIAHAREAISLYLEELLAGETGTLPAISTLEELARRPELASWTFAVVDVDLTRIEGKAERINITMPSNILRKLDAHVARTHGSRSGFIAEAVMGRMAGHAVREPAPPYRSGRNGRAEPPAPARAPVKRTGSARKAAGKVAKSTAGKTAAKKSGKAAKKAKPGKSVRRKTA